MKKAKEYLKIILKDEYIPKTDWRFYTLRLKIEKIAINNIYKLLKTNGECIITVPYFYPIHGDPDDYYRYSASALKHLCREFKEIKIISRGNKFLAIWQIFNCPIRSGNIISIFFNIFNPILARLDWGGKTITPLGYIVILKK
jgi:hypothetical protein